MGIRTYRQDPATTAHRRGFTPQVRGIVVQGCPGDDGRHPTAFIETPLPPISGGLNLQPALCHGLYPLGLEPVRH